jgi:hypothetical protein
MGYPATPCGTIWTVLDGNANLVPASSTTAHESEEHFFTALLEFGPRRHVEPGHDLDVKRALPQLFERHDDVVRPDPRMYDEDLHTGCRLRNGVPCLISTFSRHNSRIEAVTLARDGQFSFREPLASFSRPLTMDDSAHPGRAALQSPRAQRVIDGDWFSVQALELEHGDCLVRWPLAVRALPPPMRAWILNPAIDIYVRHARAITHSCSSQFRLRETN